MATPAGLFGDDTQVLINIASDAAPAVKRVISKAICDSLRGMTAAEIDCQLDGAGLTLRQRLTIRKLRNAADKKKYPLGANYYRELRSEFRSPESLEGQLDALTDPAQPLCPELAHAVQQYRKTGRRSGMAEFLCIDVAPNVSEAVQVMKFANEVAAHVSMESTQLVQALMDYMFNHKFHEQYVEAVKLMGKWLDESLCFMLTKSKGCKQSDEAFVAANRDRLALLLGGDVVDKLASHMGNDSGWMVHSTELLGAITKSTVATRLWGHATNRVLVERLDILIDTEMTEMLNGGVVSTATFAAAVSRVVVSARAIDGIAKLPARRKLTLKYRSDTIEVTVQSIKSHAEHYMMSRLREYGLEAGHLSPLLVENSLAAPPLRSPVQGINFRPILADVAAARQLVERHCHANECVAAGDIVAYLAKKEASLVSTCSTFSIEVKWFTAVQGKKGLERIQAEILENLPCEGRVVAAERAMGALNLIKQGGLFKFIDEGNQNVVLHVADCVSAIFEGRAPKLPLNPGAFLIDVKARLQFFCTFAVDGPGTAVVQASAAVNANLTFLEKKKANRTQADVEKLAVWAWMFDAEQKRRFKACVDEPAAARTSAPSARASSPAKDGVFLSFHVHAEGKSG